MPKEEWGTKRMCPQCGARFYDLRHDPMTCPVCAAEFTADSLVAGRGRAMISERAAARVGVLADADEEVIETEEDLDADATEGEIDDDLLDDEDEDADVSLDEIADVAADEEEG